MFRSTAMAVSGVVPSKSKGFRESLIDSDGWGKTMITDSFMLIEANLAKFGVHKPSQSGYKY
jgi:hypothetical protein